ncbi:MAG: M1 family metallopeptidase [Anaerolineae bacterium]|nr:M1 family metallopeptidase [Anaerolineae bacterium]
MIHKRGSALIILIGLICAALLSACAPESLTVPDASPIVQTLLPSPPGAGVQLPMPDQLAEPNATPTVLETPPQQDTTESDVRYDIDAVLNWDEHTLQVQQQVTYRNDTGHTQTEIVFNIEPNHEPDQFELTRVTRDNRALTDYTLEGARLLVPLNDHLAAGQTTDLTLDYRLALPQLQDGYSLGTAGYHLGYWGYSARQLNLGLWFPAVAAYDPVCGWITPEYHSVGEHFVLRAADFAVQIKVDGAPDGLRVAGPGDVTRPDEQTWRFELAGGREMAFSFSDQFELLSTVTASGVKVELYYLSDPEADTLSTARHALHTAADALALYEELYGPYPRSRLVVVEGDFPDGMEFSGLVYVGEGWFRTWHGTPNEWLTIITAHEVSHQWWYALVGNDQGNCPYLDEMLAIYSEVLFFEHYYPDYLDWWWQFRVATYLPAGYVDAPVYDFYSARGYINAVYLRGAMMMDALRHDLGDEAFLAWLRAYADQMAGQVAYPADFWGLLPEDSYASTEQTRLAYLQQADVFASPE